MRYTGCGIPSPFCVPAAPRHTGRRVKTAIHPITNRRFFLISGTYAPASAVQMARAVLRGLQNDEKGGFIIGASRKPVPSGACGFTVYGGFRFKKPFAGVGQAPPPVSAVRKPSSRHPFAEYSLSQRKKKKYSPSKAQTIRPLELMVGIEPTTC